MLHGPGVTKRQSNLSYPTNSHLQVKQKPVNAVLATQGDYDFAPMESNNPNVG